LKKGGEAIKRITTSTITPSTATWGVKKGKKCKVPQSRNTRVKLEKLSSRRGVEFGEREKRGSTAGKKSEFTAY